MGCFGESELGEIRVLASFCAICFFRLFPSYLLSFLLCLPHIGFVSFDACLFRSWSMSIQSVLVCSWSVCEMSMSPSPFHCLCFSCSFLFPSLWHMFSSALLSSPSCSLLTFHSTLPSLKSMRTSVHRKVLVEELQHSMSTLHDSETSVFLSY